MITPRRILSALLVSTAAFSLISRDRQASSEFAFLEKKPALAEKQALEQLDKTIESYVRKTFDQSARQKKTPLFIVGEDHTNMATIYVYALLFKHVKNEADKRKIAVAHYNENPPKKYTGKWSIANPMSKPQQSNVVSPAISNIYGFHFKAVDIDTTFNYPVKNGKPVYPSYVPKSQQGEDLDIAGFIRRNNGMARKIIQTGCCGILDTGFFHPKGVKESIEKQSSPFLVFVLHVRSSLKETQYDMEQLQRVHPQNELERFQQDTVRFIYNPKHSLQLPIPKALTDEKGESRFDAGFLPGLIGAHNYEKYITLKFEIPEKNTLEDVQTAFKKAPALIQGVLDGRYRISWQGTGYSVKEVADIYAEDPEFFDLLLSSHPSRYIAKKSDTRNPDNPFVSLQDMRKILGDLPVIVFKDPNFTPALWRSLIVDFQPINKEKPPAP